MTNNNPMEQSILDNLLQKRKEVNAAQTQQQQDPLIPPVTPINPANLNLQDNVTKFETKKDVIAPTVNEFGYDPDTQAYLDKNGFTIDRLKKLANFDPTKGDNFLSHIYESSIPKPVAPDEKALKNKRTIAGVADGLSMLAQMYSAGKGAHMRERDFNQSAIAGRATQEKNLRDLYLQQSNRYNDGLLNARTKDFLLALEEYKEGKKGVREVLKTLAADKKYKEAQDWRESEAKRAQGNIDREFIAQEEHRKEANKIAKMRTYNSGRDTSKRESKPIYVPALPGDSNVIERGGLKMIAIPMDEGHVSGIANVAWRDKEFLDKMKDYLYLDNGVDRYGKPKQGKPIDDYKIAAYYIDYERRKSSQQFSPQQFNNTGLLNLGMPWMNPVGTTSFDAGNGIIGSTNESGDTVYIHPNGSVSSGMPSDVNKENEEGWSWIAEK